jgi:hypothetical protein
MSLTLYRVVAWIADCTVRRFGPGKPNRSASTWLHKKRHIQGTGRELFRCVALQQRFLSFG